MNKTTIEWTDYVWNPVTGCDKVSAGCRSCYAETFAIRFWGDRKFTDVQMQEERLFEPKINFRKWYNKKVFVCSMSDLFHEAVTFEFIVKVFREFREHPYTTFQILTKRPARALEFFKWAAPVLFTGSNVWIGVSCENQQTANERIPLLLQIPAAVRFLSCEPLLGPIDISSWFYPKEFVGMDVSNIEETQHSKLEQSIHWVIAGGESGHMARPMHPDWVRSLRDQCNAANVPFFFKQWGEYVPSNRESSNFLFALPEYPLQWMARVGKSKSGNLLDGKQHLEFPPV